MQGSVPYAAWRASPTQLAGKRAAVVAALAWDRQLLLLDVPLTRPAEEAPAGMHASPLLLRGWFPRPLMCRYCTSCMRTLQSFVASGCGAQGMHGFADGQQTGADSASQQAAIAPSVTQKWNLDHPVIGVAWLEGPSLAVIQEQGTRTLIHLYNQQGQDTFLHVLAGPAVMV